MSILINGMEMPTRCEECPCFYPEFKECNAIVGRLVDGKGTPPSDCPLLPVPPHGRLIDADAEMEKLKRICLPDDLAYTVGYSIAMRRFEDAPTIIPAEEGE